MLDESQNGARSFGSELLLFCDRSRRTALFHEGKVLQIFLINSFLQHTR
jgi:hypothetical protein